MGVLVTLALLGGFTPAPAAVTDRLRDSNITALEDENSRLEGVIATLNTHLAGLKSSAARQSALTDLLINRFGEGLGGLLSKDQVEALITSAKTDWSSSLGAVELALTARIARNEEAIKAIEDRLNDLENFQATATERLDDLEAGKLMLHTTFLAGADLDATAFGTLEAGASWNALGGFGSLGVLVGGEGDPSNAFLFGFTAQLMSGGEFFRGGVAGSVVINTAGEHVELLPQGALELGSPGLHAALRVGFPFVAANKKAAGEFEPLQGGLGLGGRF
ncbi:MAG: hypothetical protein KBD15_00650 [Candidatus Magasanikbacteria bacterium]|nr:hypothetical protein [Candidatus Magasanikbacteria bacterium]